MKYNLPNLKPLLLLVVLNSVAISGFAQVQINEVVASNSNSLTDELGDSPDWIELYNNGTEAVNLSGWGISDKSDNLFKSILPDTLINPGGFVILFASESEIPDSIKQYIHLDFKLSADGETVYLSNTDSSLVDSLSFPALETDYSFGRVPDSDVLAIFAAPTPLAANNTQAYQDRLPTPVVDQSGGFYNTSSVQVKQINAALAGKVHYTIDGSDPTAESPILNHLNGLTISETTPLKLQAFDDAMLPSELITQTYFVGVQHDLTVVSLVTEPDNLFDPDHGIYIHYEDDVEIPAHIELYETDGSLGFKSGVGAKMYGAYSRNFDQKSFSIFFRGQYGQSELDYKLFEEKDIDTFQSFLLRNAGNDFGAAHMRDATMSTIFQDVLDLDYQAYRPAVLYINGEYWGIQNIREKISEHFIASNHDLDSDDIDLLEAGEEPVVANGSADDWLDFLSELETANITDQTIFDEVTAHIDVENFIDYMATEIFYANTDWPAINVKYWREQSENGKWRWIVYDLDHGFNLYSGQGDYNLDMMEHTLQTNPNQLKYGNPLWSTLVFRTLMENDDFKRRFVTRISGLMNTTFKTERMITVIDSLSSIIAGEMPAHEERWNLISGWTGEGPFISQVEDMRHFARNRHTYMFQHLQTHLGFRRLPGSIFVDVSDQQHGQVMVNRTMPNSYPYEGLYFSDYDLTLTAIPNKGYKFVGWSGDYEGTEAQIQIDTRDAVTAIFEPLAATTSPIVINEIMYNNSDEQDTGDWIELHNPTNNTVDLSNWIVKDEDDDHSFVIASGTEIPAGGYLVITQNLSAFNQFYSGVSPILGDMDFGLAGGSDDVRIFDNTGELIDYVSYDDEDPWDSEADGTGYSLELTNPFSDNMLPESWSASTTMGGTPGVANSSLVSIDQETMQPTSFILNQNYPNPFNPSTIISYQLPESSLISVKIFDTLGREITTLFDGKMSAGEHQIQFDGTGLSSGVYIYQLQTKDFVQTRKMLLLK